MADLGLVKTYCDICNFEFADALLYYMHEQECHLETAKLSIPSGTDLPTTVTITQEEGGTYTCNKCCIHFSNSRTLQLHLTSKCMKITQDETLLDHSSLSDTNHVTTDNITISQYQNEAFICPNCDVSFPTQPDLHHHLRHTCIANKDEYYCNLCDNGFPYMRFLRDHYDSIHAQVIKIRDPKDSTVAFGSEIQVERNDAGYFCCPTCGLRYKLATSFKNHLRRPCTETKDLEMCDICNRYFDGANGLISHKYNYHHREITIKGIYLRDYERQVAFTRDDDEEFICPVCQFKSNNSSTFKDHVLKKPCRGEIVKKSSHGRKFNVSAHGKILESQNSLHRTKTLN